MKLNKFNSTLLLILIGQLIFNVAIIYGYWILTQGIFKVFDAQDELNKEFYQRLVPEPAVEVQDEGKTS